MLIKLLKFSNYGKSLKLLWIITNIMPYKWKYIFFNCTHCGEVYYTKVDLAYKRCLKCNRKFPYKNSIKISISLTQEQAIQLIQEIKKLKAEKSHLDLRELIEEIILHH